MHKVITTPSGEDEKLIADATNGLLAGLSLVMIAMPPDASEQVRKSILLSTAMNFLAQCLHEMTNGEAEEALQALALVHTMVHEVISAGAKFTSAPSGTVN